MSDDADVLPVWMRGALFATAVMNILVAAAFAPSAGAVRALAGMPEAEQPIYLAIVGLFVMLFGVAYLWVAVTGRPERFFIAVAAAGKTGFVALLGVFWAGGTLPFRTFLAGTADLVFAILFVTWLAGARTVRAEPARAAATGATGR